MNLWECRIFKTSVWVRMLLWALTFSSKCLRLARKLSCITYLNCLFVNVCNFGARYWLPNNAKKKKIWKDANCRRCSRSALLQSYWRVEDQFPVQIHRRCITPGSYWHTCALGQLYLEAESVNVRFRTNCLFAWVLLVLACSNDILTTNWR